jgi:hypothetical protein
MSRRGYRVRFGDLRANDRGPHEMNAAADPPDSVRSRPTEDLGFLPDSLLRQCRRLIESYHGVNGYSCLPDMLWRSQLGPFIERQEQLAQLLKKASTTRSAKKSNESFVKIATAILALEILASSFAGWSAIFPEAGETARLLLRRNAISPKMPLMEFYVYPPKYVSSIAIATLTPPSGEASGQD